MLVRPHTLSIITTHQCTAACDHCCFGCTPKIKKAIPVPRLYSLIDEAADLGSIRLVVFTGGECFLLGEDLVSLIAHATAYGFATRCVTNGYWARTREAAERRVERVVAAGLKEINFSTGTFHSAYVPVESIVNGALATSRAGLVTLINVEIFEGTTFPVERLTKHVELGPLIERGEVLMQRNVWIDAGGESELVHSPTHSRFLPERKSGCTTVLNVITVTPDQHLVACCGLHLEKIPELHLGSIADASLGRVLASASDDFVKIWIHVEGPERVLEFVNSVDPSVALPTKSSHPCETCLHLYSNERAREVIAAEYHRRKPEVMTTYMAGLAGALLGDTISKTCRDASE